MDQEIQDKLDLMFKNWSSKSEERISSSEDQMKFLVLKFQEHTQKVESCFKDLEYIKNKFDSLSDSVFNFNKDLNFNLNESVVRVDLNEKLANKQILEVYEKVKECKRSIDVINENNYFMTKDFSEFSLDLNCKLENLKSLQKNVEEFHLFKDQIQSIYLDLQNKSKMNDDEIKYKSIEIEKIKISIDSLNELFSSIQIKIDMQIQNLYGENEKTNGNFESLQSSIKLIDNKIGNFLNTCKKYTDDKICQVIFPDISQFILKEDVLKLQLSIDRMGIDAKNAYLKSSNNDQQITLINKKLETLQLLQKQSELSR